MLTRQPCPGDIPDAEGRFVVPYLRLPPEGAGQRVHDPRDVLDAARRLVRSGSPWRYLPEDLPPWEMVYQQTRRRLAAGCFEAIVHDLRAVLRFADGRATQSTPESGSRAGYDGSKRKKGSKVHMAVDTPGHLPALRVTPADVQDRDRVAALAEAVQEATGDSVELAYVDQGYTGADAGIAAADEGIDLEVVKPAEGKRGFVLLPRRWVVERSFAWAARFRRLARDYERLTATSEGMHYLAFSFVMLRQAAPHFAWSS